MFPGRVRVATALPSFAAADGEVNPPLVAPPVVLALEVSPHQSLKSRNVFSKQVAGM